MNEISMNFALHTCTYTYNPLFKHDSGLSIHLNVRFMLTTIKIDMTYIFDFYFSVN